MSVVNMMVGATSPDGATFAVKVNGGGPVRVAVADNTAMTNPAFTNAEAVDAQGVAKVSIAGLDSATRHHWQVEDNGVLDTSVTGRFDTHPAADLPASYTLTVAACAGAEPAFPGVAGGELDPERVSNHPVYDTIRTAGQLMHVNLGDWGYPDFGDHTAESLANRRRYYDDNLAQPRQAQLMRKVAQWYTYDDHDFAANNSDGTYPDKANAVTVYAELFPGYPLDSGGADGIYQAKQIGRVLWVLLDTRYNRSPNGDPDGPAKTMLGATQKTWLSNLLAASSAKVLVVLSSSRWLGSSAEGWLNYATEYAEISDLFQTHFPGATFLVGGDRHAVGITGGATNPIGGWPVASVASIDSTFSAPVSGTYDVVPDTPGRGQYATVTITDLGNLIAVRLAVWRGTTLLGSYRQAVQVSQPAPAPGALLRTLSGSHRATFDARVVTTFQTGDDPDGETIPIIDGEVTLDGSAKTRGTLSLTTVGINKATGMSRFPRGKETLLAPYGNELFVRRGVDLGGNGILWVPLGYYRIDSTEQSSGPYGPIRLTGSDRMKTIRDSRLIEPRQYGPGTTVGGVFADLVQEVYPGAVIAFDDGAELSTLGRALVVEEERYEALLNLANALGKIMFWDGEGILRVETAPDPTVIVWEVKAGRDGVLVQPSRRLTRDGVYNAVVARGEGGDEVDPVVGVATDNNPNSPTRFGGPFGRIPRYFSSSFLTTTVQAETAAQRMLTRGIGLPYSVDFGAITNPSLKPYEAVLVEQRDYNRERHVMDTVTIPLVYDTRMKGTTRDQTFRTLNGA